MPTEELEKTKSAFSRWLDGETLSIEDAQRWVAALTRIPIQLSTPNQEQGQAMLAALRSGLRETYLKEQ